MDWIRDSLRLLHSSSWGGYWLMSEMEVCELFVICELPFTFHMQRIEPPGLIR